jgi:hypothetical protein
VGLMELFILLIIVFLFGFFFEKFSNWLYKIEQNRKKTIYVNGKKVVYPYVTISYSDLAYIAMEFEPTVVYYTKHKSGTLCKSQSIEVENNMKFTVVHTGNA